VRSTPTAIPSSHEAIERLVAPRSIAILGASSDRTKVGALPLHFLRKYGYAGRIFPVNPTSADIDGLVCYPSVKAIPETVDLLVVSVPAERVVRALEECERGKVTTALVLTSGYAEMGAEGEARQAELCRVAHERGIRLCGPNSVGSVNLWNAVVATISQAFDQTMEPGPIAFVTQSGALGTAVVAVGRAAGIKVGHFISTGNEADLDFADFCEYFVDDPRTRVIAGYIEGVRDGRKFAAALGHALRAGKPVVLLKVGRSAVGQAAARSHTGALVGADEVYRAVMAEHGAVRASSIEALIDCLKMFAAIPGEVSERLGLLSHSGGTGVLMADVCDDHGLRVPPADEALRARLAQRLPAYAAFANPIDMTANVVFRPRLMVDCLDDVLASPEFDAALLSVNLIWRAADELADALVELRARGAKPFAVAWIGMPERVADRLQAGGVPVYPDPVRSVQAMAAAVSWTRARRGAAGGDAQAATAPARVARPPADYAGQAELLARYALPLVPWRLVRTAEEARAAAAALDSPLALKAIASAISHKSDAGGVVLGVEGEGEVVRTFEKLFALVQQHAGEGVLVQPMIEGALEVFVGARRDPIFGPVIAVGLGGIYVEVLRDVVVRLAPVSTSRARAAILEARWSPLLRGIRGQRPRDVDALADVVERLSRLVDLCEIESLDLNPVMVLTEGSGVRIADFRILT
jgi:acyl-CoA synthetase (NDP forming)